MPTATLKGSTPHCVHAWLAGMAVSLSANSAKPMAGMAVNLSANSATLQPGYGRKNARMRTKPSRRELGDARDKNRKDPDDPPIVPPTSSSSSYDPSVLSRKGCPSETLTQQD